MRNTKVLRCFLFTLLLLVGLLGSGEVVFAVDEVITINFVTQPFASPRNVPKIKDYIEQFERENPNIKIEVTVATTDDKYRTKLLQDVAAGNVPDVAFIDGSWLAEFNQLNALNPLDKWFTPEKQAQYFDFAIKGATLDGKLKALWFHTGDWALYYRKDLLEKAGFTAPPKDWNELLKIGKKLTVDSDNDGVIDTYGLGIPGHRDVVTSCTFLPWFWGHEDVKLATSNEIVFDKGKNKEAMIDTLQFIRKLVEEEVVTKDMPSLKFTDVESDFVSGASAMAILGNWHYASIKNYGGEDFVKNVEIAPIPAVPGYESVTTTGGWTIAMFTKDPDKMDAAWKWMEYFGSMDIQKALTIDAAQMTTLKAVYDEPEIVNDLVMQSFKETLFGGRTRPGVSFYSAIDNHFQILVQSAAIGKEDLEEAVEKAGNKARADAEAMK